MHFNTGYCINLKDIHSRIELQDLVFKLNTVEGYSLPLVTVDDMMHELYDIKSFYRYIGVSSNGDILLYHTSPWYYSDSVDMPDDLRQPYGKVLNRVFLEGYLK